MVILMPRTMIDSWQGLRQMHKSRLGTVIIDCQTDDLGREADFWSAALGATTESSERRGISAISASRVIQPMPG